MNQHYLPAVTSHRVFAYADLNFGVAIRQLAMQVHTIVDPIKIYSNGPGHTCFTLPVSSTGSLWAGYGGWHHRVCSFLAVEWANPHLNRSVKQISQFIEPNAEFKVKYPITLHQPTLCFKFARFVAFLSLSNHQTTSA